MNKENQSPEEPTEWPWEPLEWLFWGVPAVLSLALVVSNVYVLTNSGTILINDVPTQAVWVTIVSGAVLFVAQIIKLIRHLLRLHRS